MEPIKNSTNDLISFILKQKINPINKPKIVPNNPIRNPLIINILRSCGLETPRTLNIPISFFFVDTQNH